MGRAAKGLRNKNLCNSGWLWSSEASPQPQGSGGSLRSTPATLVQQPGKSFLGGV